MGLRNWINNVLKMDDEVAARRAAGSEYETAEERELAEGSRMGRAADERVARRAGLASTDDLDRMGSGE
jgi:hypothetical protein